MEGVDVGVRAEPVLEEPRDLVVARRPRRRAGRDAGGRMNQSPGRWTEFSYPAILEVRPGVLGVTYTWNRQRIAYLELPI